MSGHPGGDLDEAFALALFKALVASVDSYMTCIDRQRRMLFVNRTLTSEVSDLLGKPIEEFITPPHREAAIECVERAFRSAEPQQIELSVVLAQGARHPVVMRVVPFRGPSGEELAALITNDVSERRRLTEELERSMEFRRVVENLPDYVALVDRQYRLLWANRLAPRLRWEDVIGAKLDVFVAPEGLHKAHLAIDAAFETGAVGHYEHEAYGDGESMAWYAVRVLRMPPEGKIDGVLLITTNITERRRAEQALRQTEEQLQRAQRLESLGQLAGGIAHDFNNLLQVIEGNLAFAKEGLQKGEMPIEELDQALRATERAAELTSHLLTIGRKKRVDSKRVDLGALVEHSVRMLRRAIPENVVLKYDLPEARYFVALDASQFEQVLINLCVNARDAMAGGGTLTIRIDPDGPSHLVMSVRDTGTGIAPENLNRVFEPFFTTKGTGSGLGLAVAAGIVAAHGGILTAESDGRQGTTMKVRLPRVVLGSEAPAAELEEAPRGCGLILVAEDEDLVRAQVERILRRAGYRVLTAKNGAQAVAVFRQQQTEIDLVILDVVMPELDGWQAFLAMERLDPSVRVLFTTGYAANVLPENFAERGARLLSKPYKPQHLVGEVRDLLAPPRQPRR